MKVGYIVTFYINKNKDYYEYDMQLAKQCFDSLINSEGVCLFLYNQGSLTLEEIHDFMKSYDFEYYILGEGKNVGIPKAKYEIIKYILKNHVEIEYIAETHLDMIFMPNWHIPLIQFLEENDEPMVCPRIVCGSLKNNFIQDNRIPVNFPKVTKEISEYLSTLTENKVIYNFTHPVLYRVKDLKRIHYFDPGFLTAKQELEDTSMLIGFRYYMGTKSEWRVKCCLKSCVYHMIEGQRLRTKESDDYQKNLQGLIKQYGAYGINEWFLMDGNPYWKNVYESLIIDQQAYK